MKRSRAGVFVMVLQAAVLLAGLFAAASTAPDEKTKTQQHDPGPLTQSLNGRDIYRAHCATCHGIEGKGDGPVAPALTTKMRIWSRSSRDILVTANCRFPSGR